MAVKFYSDVTKKYYDDENAALQAEEALAKERDEATARRKEMAEKVEEKRKAYLKASSEYKEILGEFCKQYGAYHYTLNNRDIEEFFDSFFRW